MSNNISFKTVESVRRLNNSTMGNPAWMFTFTDGTEARTSSNVSFSYEVCGDGREDGKNYNVTFTRAGRITDMRHVPPVNLNKDYEVRVFGKVQAGVSPHRPIAIYAGLSVANVHSLRVRFAGTGYSLYTFKYDPTAKI